jgi:hypothetical protein
MGPLCEACPRTLKNKKLKKKLNVTRKTQLTVCSQQETGIKIHLQFKKNFVIDIG